MSKKEKEIIKNALTLEQEGYEFYQMAAENSEDRAVSDAFKQLAQEEVKHMDWLKELYSKISEDTRSEISFEDPPDVPQIFDWEEVSHFKGSMAMSVFGVGVKMEKSAVEYYQEAAKETELKVARDLYETLIEWEKGHLKDFEKQYQLLQEDWWNEQGFAPF